MPLQEMTVGAEFYRRIEANRRVWVPPDSMEHDPWRARHMKTPCKCGSDRAVILRDRSLRCRRCGAPR